MAPDDRSERALETVVRGIAAAAKTLRLYPSTSPIPRQSVGAAVAALDGYLTERPVLTLTVARDGFIADGRPVATSVGGGDGLADMLRSHGVAEVTLATGCSADDLLALLGAIMASPEQARAAGGVPSVLQSCGVTCVRVGIVSLTLSAHADAVDDDAVDEFFRDLSADPAKLSTWLEAATKGDPTTLAEGLDEISSAGGPSGAAFAETLAKAFAMQNADGKDALLSLGLEHGRARDLIGQALCMLSATDVADSLADGMYGRNMLSLSSALTHLPLEGRMGEIIAEVRAALPQKGRMAKEVEFLEHMLHVRASKIPEPALTDAKPTYAQMAEAARVAPEQVARARDEIADSVAGLSAAGVTTMLTLLDQQQDFPLYVKSLDGLSAMVPRLLERGDLDLAATILRELSGRQSRAVQPWPDLSERLRAAILGAMSRRSMGALLDSVLAEPGHHTRAREILNIGGDQAQVAFVEEAVARRDDAALDGVAALLGRRMSDLLPAASRRAEWSQLQPIVRRLVTDGDTYAVAALDEILRRPDEQVRREAVAALGGSSSPVAVRLLETALSDAAGPVATAAARALAKTASPSAASSLSRRLGELDADGRDFALAREVIAALAQVRDPEAKAALTKLADRRALIKRGHFAEVQNLAREALALQGKAGDR